MIAMGNHDLFAYLFLFVLHEMQPARLTLNQRLDQSLKDEKSYFYTFDHLRNKMGGELFFYGNQIPLKASILEVGFENGLIHSLNSKFKQR